MSNFMGLGLPIGREFYPNCPGDGSPATLKNYDPQCKTVLSSLPEGAAGKINSPNGQIFKTALKDPGKWLFVVIISGALIGLGGPFWFDVASKLGGIRRNLRGDGNAAQPAQPSKPDDDHDAEIEKITADSASKSAGKQSSKRRKTKSEPPDDLSS
jgi:hypothetical protein